mmetsp:Transcript_11564/g.33258  ORF Transcript_11564/g.33258 Transcript_11564/m.33258 type:complete len:203 (-) Transcript_11564:1089-1697(-)
MPERCGVVRMLVLMLRRIPPYGAAWGLDRAGRGSVGKTVVMMRRWRRRRISPVVGMRRMRIVVVHGRCLRAAHHRYRWAPAVAGIGMLRFAARGWRRMRRGVPVGRMVVGMRVALMGWWMRRWIIPAVVGRRMHARMVPVLLLHLLIVRSGGIGLRISLSICLWFCFSLYRSGRILRGRRAIAAFAGCTPPSGFRFPLDTAR